MFKVILLQRIIQTLTQRLTQMMQAKLGTGRRNRDQSSRKRLYHFLHSANTCEHFLGRREGEVKMSSVKPLILLVAANRPLHSSVKALAQSNFMLKELNTKNKRKQSRKQFRLSTHKKGRASDIKL